MHLDVKTMYNVAMTPEELRLVGLSLAGKIKPGSDEQSAAAALNLRLMELRLKQHRQATEVAEGAYRSATAASSDSAA